MAHLWRGVIEEYRDRLPVTASDARRHPRGGRHAAGAGPRTCPSSPGARCCLKVEGSNPTGSFKDRGMTTAISKAAEAGAQAVICASTGNTSASAAAYATAAGLTLRRARAGRQDRDGQAQPGDRPRRDAAAGRRQLRRLPHAGPQARRGLPGRAGQLGQPVPHRGAEDRRLRGRRRPRRRPRHPLPAGRQRRQHHGVLEGLHRVRRRRPGHARTPRMWGFQAAGAAPIVAATRSTTPRPSRPRSASATRRRGTRRRPPGTTPAGASTP